jgi:hypothetical protein
MGTAHSDLDILIVVKDGSHRRSVAQDVYRTFAGLGVATDIVVVMESDVERYRHVPCDQTGVGRGEGSLHCRLMGRVEGRRLGGSDCLQWRSRLHSGSCRSTIGKKPNGAPPGARLEAIVLKARTDSVRGRPGDVSLEGLLESTPGRIRTCDLWFRRPFGSFHSIFDWFSLLAFSGIYHTPPDPSL